MGNLYMAPAKAEEILRGKSRGGGEMRLKGEGGLLFGGRNRELIPR